LRIATIEEASMSETNDWNQKVIDEFRASGGRVGGEMEGWPLLLLHHVGAKSGIERVTPVVYRELDEGGSLAVFASKAGAPTNPDWFHNLVANPRTTIEIGAETRTVKARVAAGDERGRIWAAQKRAFPNFGEYEKSAGAREIPVVILERAA
jgi:deazaflavin-dependent oxidoreductase (nitroreductase family)